MTQVTYPGVYIEEVSSGVHTITSVSTSITAFVDYFREGPMDTPVEIFGMSDFQRIFGGLDTRSEASYAIAQFFLNGGGTALVIRSATDDTAGGNPLATASVGIRAPTLTGAAVLEIQAASPGIWGNALRVEIDANSNDPDKLFNMTATRYDSDQPNARPIGQERHLNLSLLATHPRYVVNVIRDDSHLIEAIVPAATTGVPAPCGTTSGPLPPATLTQAVLDALGTGPQTFKVAVSGRTYLGTLPTWPAAPAPAAVTNIFQVASRLEQAIRTAADTSATPVPTPPALTGATVTAFGDRLGITAGRGDSGLTFSDTMVFTTGAAVTLKLTAASTDNVQQYALGSDQATTAGYVHGTKGRDGIPPGADALVGAVAQASNEGIFALERVDLFNILCVPRAVAGGAVAPLTDTQASQIVNAAIAYCERKRAFFLLDIPESINEVPEIKNWLDAPAHASFRHKNVAVFFPRTNIPDPLNDYRLRSVGTSGTMAGIFAKTDAERGVFKAGAGVEAVLRGVTELAVKLTDTENGTLNPLAINCLRAFPVYGMLSWGARTLVGADQMANEWKYIPVRRLALMLEESLFRGTKWVVFEPNDEPLWARIRLNISAYMTSLFRQGAFQGATPKEAFYVKCDKETTTQDDRNKGIVNIEVGFAPLKPAEFVVIKIQQMPGDL